ncbi:NRDE family protein [Rhodospirillum rubrum]|uniref:NRDE family protein n=1 Tax=Rhodospirillum rubrum (strain ATCC 11170 / ATH 1.1.1 / DSM 467 / LMG 4362 / NCIMB 8255 / S1) TaxID=269796 RepID=Q2RWH8_RHORT|nr:NRDE family protein [Rhodospirillum rubrum]ABC21517.1 Protein of unknown function DUF833 [Rhodospirillum rubrum ATCC 11170]AEO47202.1 hypothetical protein F11_03660 [Rhodospirillum rubrum F11]MBK5953114.1 hypothetical protein [Rhodospirillum rubrum]QXG81190.1 NRDE family protein [Rhodospirillum rubrum]HCF18843.1 hypothetical protein [Rhodospirillum rubrum]
MCTVVIDRRPGDPWPLLVAANRDELADRPWLPPARHWPSRPEVIAGLDELAGGTWMGLNDWGVVACVLNREGTLGPLAGRRSRGELVLDALDMADARDAAEALADIDPRAYRPFNLIVADNRDAFWIRHADAEGRAAVEVHPLAEGLTLMTAHDPDDPLDARARAYLPRFRAAPRPDPQLRDGWAPWTHLLGSRDHAVDDGPTAAMCFSLAGGFGTSSSSLIALPAMERIGVDPLYLFAPAPPDQTDYRPVLGGGVPA